MESEQFGAYRIEGLIGRGGMGEVYRAYDTEHERVVALKVLSEHLAADRGYRERFRREAHLAARLNEPHVVPIHRYGEVDGRLFLDMRLVEGEDVAALLAREGHLSPSHAVSIVGQVARALDAAHADGLVHRDVKPSNVLVTGDGEDQFVYLVDFGIARSTTDMPGPALTQTGAALGSFDYMAPERFLEKPIDKRVDVYALACVLFECLTGRRPFTGDGLATLMYAHLNTAAPMPSSVRPDLPSAFDDVVRTGLSKDPDQRYASAGELAAAARTALRDSGMLARPELITPPAAPTSITRLPFVPQTLGFSSPGAPGGYGPPSQPGAPTGYGSPSYPGAPSGYGPPSQPGAPGGYGPPSQPGAPSGYGPPSQPGPPTGNPPPRGATANGRRNPLVLIAIGTLVVIVVMVAGSIALFGGDGGPTGPTGPTETTDPSTSTGPTADDERLRAIVPGEFGSEACVPQPLSGDGDLSALRCGAAAAAGGPDQSDFFLYRDRDTLRAAFEDYVDSFALTQFSDAQECTSSNQGWNTWTRQSESESSGHLACFVDSDGNAVITWTDEDFLAAGTVTVTGGGADGVPDVWSWWRTGTNSDFSS